MWEIQNVRAAPTTISLPWHEKDHDDDDQDDGDVGDDHDDNRYGDGDDEDNGHHGDGGEDDEWWRNWKDGRRFHRSTDEAVKYAKYVGLTSQDAEHNDYEQGYQNDHLDDQKWSSLMRNRLQDRYNSEESLEEENQSTTSSTESRQSDFAKKEEGFIPTRR